MVLKRCDYVKLCSIMSKAPQATAQAEQSNQAQPLATLPLPGLYGIEGALEAMFPDDRFRPSIRTFNKWRAKGYYPYIKLGKRVLIDPILARRALDARFTIHATD